MKSKDVTIDKTNAIESMRQAVSEAEINVSNIQMQAQEAKQEEQELEQKLLEAELAAEIRKEAVERGKETQEKITEVAGG